jgi:RNA polymerase sigma factor (sigma-70 family)
MQRGSQTLEREAGTAHRAEFDRVYREQRRAVERHLTYLTGDRSLAEDLTQETFGRLYERGADPDGQLPRNERAWLLTVASNLAYNHFRSESRRTAREDAVAGGGAAGAAHTPDLDAVIDVRTALARLDARDRTVILLRHTGFSYAEIAEAVDIAAGSVGTTLARAQGRFREVYEGTTDSRRAADKE